MDLLETPDALRAACDAARAAGRPVGLVPTMGALHAGHATLIDEARRRAGFVVVSIFVNPTQFGPGEDLARYPRALDADVALASAHGAHAVFAPAPDAMYPPGDETRVRVGRTAAALCGAHRPGHFEGVATVVTKLFALAGPCTATFGRKDFQQLRVVTRLARDLFLPVEIVPVATVREPDGLALSSRNRYLSPDQRARALAIAEGLGAAVRAFAAGERRAGVLRAAARAPVERAFDAIDYVELADADDVTPIEDGALVAGPVLLAVAARLGGTRLIDNVVLGEDPPPRQVHGAG
jgi:pantoate--beta-alanine ligase